MQKYSTYTIVLVALLAFHCLTPDNSWAGDSAKQVAEPLPSKTSDVGVESGFLFIDSQCIPAPFDIRINKGKLTIGEHTFNAIDYAKPNEDGRRRRGKFGARFSERSSIRVVDIAKTLASQIGTMETGSVIILQKKQSPITLDRARAAKELLEILVAKSRPNFESIIPENLISRQEVNACENIVQQYDPTPKFLANAERDLAAINVIQDEVISETDALVWTQKVAYPMTVFAMIIVVLSFGHLLSNAPNSMPNPSDPEYAGTVRGVVSKSLLFIGAMSIIDLVWTIAATQNNAMQELNPLGKGLVHDPLGLVAFKALVTGASLSLLYIMHRYPIAQRASWWCCLVLTLLTARWLTFQSMFV